ncbi:hypothetical protein P3T36_006894 [Kitasatospora sp. MAP12-15]|uniref:hypothetical protein n=1 Tax=unclassified Kitasatospora TaxID=2633591 RepID=UPI002475E80C|nr:hypothetical protein [Kitasatospora sp. MAP12-44]MDH6111923.1 hypothetical protein [Kitasatospora sp. MAP12-44]
MTSPVPPPAPRTNAEAWLRRELWHARNAGEHAQAERLQLQLDALTAEPRPETTAAAPPARETTSRTHPSSRSARVPRK